MAQISPTSQGNISSLISQIMTLERQPIYKLEQKKSDIEVLQAVYGDLKSTLVSLQTLADDLTDSSEASLTARSVTSSDADVVTATATTDAALGSHDVFVSQLARHHTMVSDQFTADDTSLATSLGAGEKTFTVTVNEVATEVSVNITAGQTNADIMSAVASAINAAISGVEDGVSATALSDTSATRKLVLRSDATGSTLKMQLDDVSGGLLAALGIADESVAATDTTGGYIYADDNLDAVVVVDGINVRRESNVLDDVINGVTLTLHGTQDTGADSVSLAVKPNQETVRETVDDFISKFNDALSYLDRKTSTDPESGARQALGGKYLYSDLLGDLKLAVSNMITTGSDSIRMLSDIGITQANDGSLAVTDDEQFAEALESDPDAVAALFTSSTDGLAGALDTLIEPFTGVGGYLDTERSNLEYKTDAIDSRIERLESRAEIRQRQLTEQYSKLQEMLTILSRQQSFFAMLWQ